MDSSSASVLGDGGSYVMTVASAESDSLAPLHGRRDKNALGQGDALVVYAGAEPRFFYATYALGNVCSLAAGEVGTWNGARIELVPRCCDEVRTCVSLAVLPGDIFCAVLTIENLATTRRVARWEVSGDLRASHDYRGAVGGAKTTRCETDAIELRDGNVYPGILPRGLHVVLQARPGLCTARDIEAGAYRLHEELSLAPGEQRKFCYVVACDPDLQSARTRAAAALELEDPLAAAEQAWRSALDQDLPRFCCSHPGLEELWTFRAWLLRFSKVSRTLGHFTHPVVLEGREAYQTYCCYSAPFHALDLTWSSDPRRAVDSLAPLFHAMYDDGRYPWYVSPATRQVPVHHPSQTGLSLAAYALARAYEVHGPASGATQFLPQLVANLRWWRDQRGSDGLVRIEHPYETGMDDLRRFEDADEPFLAIDATTYLMLNARAVAQLAHAAGDAASQREAEDLQQLCEQALIEQGWNPSAQMFFDRRASDGQRSELSTLAGFYPLLIDAFSTEQLACLDALDDPQRYALPRGLPAIAADQPGFDPRSYWMGPSWPAATAHVIEALAHTAKHRDRTRLAAASRCFWRAITLHLSPRADFYERYDPLTGEPLSRFKDYMHSWWLDLFVRHLAGFEAQADGSVRVDPLPLGLSSWSFENLHHRGRQLSIRWNEAEGLLITHGGRALLHAPRFRPGDPALILPRAE